MLGGCDNGGLLCWGVVMGQVDSSVGVWLQRKLYSIGDVGVAMNTPSITAKNSQSKNFIVKFYSLHENLQYAVLTYSEEALPVSLSA